jgi:hypothetical protein
MAPTLKAGLRQKVVNVFECSHCSIDPQKSPSPNSPANGFFFKGRALRNHQLSFSVCTKKSNESRKRRWWPMRATRIPACELWPCLESDGIPSCRMKSYAFQHMHPKRVEKLAAQFTDDEVRDCLGEDKDNRAFIFEPSEGVASFMLWNAINGPIICMDDDDVRAHARLDFLRRHGYPILRSLDEIHAYAELHSWPRKTRDAG